MGGICGFIGKKCLCKDDLMQMIDRISHRGGGNNQCGAEIFQLGSGCYAGLAYRRLTIRTLDKDIVLPLSSPDKRVSAILDGEIYNYREIRKEITDYPFQTDCDTEVIIAAYLKWGIKFLDKLNGMFAIALVDRNEGALYLMRDRMGKKPLYYYVDSTKDVLFSSQIKSFIDHEGFDRKINTDVLGNYFLHLCIEAPNTIYKNVYKLGHGNVLKICGGKLSIEKYWDIANKHRQMARYEIKDYQEAKHGIEIRLKKAVRMRMEKEQPLGFSLSGGYDSALVCAIAQGISDVPIKTYTIGFQVDSLNEAVYAKRIAEHLGTKHTELYIDEKQMLALLEDIPEYYDEPFADSSQLPTTLLASLVNKDASILMTGIGGDELFGGLNIYQFVREAQKRKHIGRILYRLRQSHILNDAQMERKLPLLYRIVSDDYNPEAETQIGVNQYIRCIERILNGQPKFYYEMESRYREKDWGVRRMLLDMDTYTIEDELVKQDRGAMKYGVESRCPFYDKSVIEYSFRVPVDFKLSHTGRKIILRDIVHQYIPREIMDREKMGFYIPQDKWLREVLREQVMDYTNRDFLQKQGIFNPDETVKFINHYMKTGDKGAWSGSNYSKIVWPYFIFQQWYQKYMV